MPKPPKSKASTPAQSAPGALHQKVKAALLERAKTKAVWDRVRGRRSYHK